MEYFTGAVLFQTGPGVPSVLGYMGVF